jgi:hypothetical protein
MMNNALIHRKSILVAMRAGAAGVVLCCASLAAAQSSTGGLRQMIVGGWTLDSVVVEQGGVRRDPYGPNPKGFVSFDASGNVIYILMRADLPKIASNNRETPTPEESRAIATGALAIYGKYSLNEADGMMALQIDSATFPNWNGAGQKRQITIVGDELRVINPTTAVGGGTAYLVWKRAR